MRIGLREKILHTTPGGVRISAITWNDGPTAIRIHWGEKATEGPGITVPTDDLRNLIDALKQVDSTYGKQVGKPGEGQGAMFK